ncbi:hypothetical protein EJ06DRAFT_530585 [Trichodelitschia bisporula]|uniref:ATP phosphoribosyltransferase n=1 Tax=Trichodelitschia bisporula TaxID=703511 RepID=A0A6G1HUQ9_9PEZI|nr:hypothetical protein EJ06DRAFT_530585 [Trichodelitschia bisporula]
MATTVPRFKLVFFTPVPAATPCKAAVFATGAGRIGSYYECAFTTQGVGQFRPGDVTNPATGKVRVTETVPVPELKIEMVCYEDEGVRMAIAALKE